MPEQINLHALPRVEQQRVLERLIDQHRTKLLETYPNVIDISLGINCRGGCLRNRKGLVLKFWVRKKTKNPRRAIPPVLKRRCKVRSSTGETPKWANVLVPTDVLPVARGQVHGRSATIRCAYQGRSVRGCLTARVRWRNDRCAWLSAAHVLSAFSVSHRSDATGTVRYSGQEIGRTIPETCWCIDYESELRVDAGLVEEQYVRPIDPEWIAGTLSKSLPPNKITAGGGCKFVNQNNNEIPIEWHCWVPGGTQTFKLATNVVRKYPRFLHFTGESRPGDSGGPVYKKMGRGRALIGVLVGGIRIDGMNGIAVIPFQDVVDALYLKHEHTMTLLPFVV